MIMPWWRSSGRCSRAARASCWDLAGLSVETVQQLAQSITPVAEIDRLTGFLYRLSQGNPFMLLETLNEMQERGLLQLTAEALDPRDRRRVGAPATRHKRHGAALAA